jgi:hypothetical protein
MARNTEKKKQQSDDDVARARNVINRELVGQPRQQEKHSEKGESHGQGNAAATPHGRPGDA